MKILIVTSMFKPELGGSATYAAEFSKRLAAAGHTVKVVTYSDTARYEGDAAYTFPIVRIVRSRMRNFGKLLNYIRLFIFLMKEIAVRPSYDIIYSFDWFSAGGPLWLASFLRGKRYYMRVDGDSLWEKYLSEGRSPLALVDFYTRGLYRQYRFMYILIRLVVRRASIVIFNSDIQRDLYQTYYGLSAGHTCSIYNPVPEHQHGTLVQSYKKKYADRDHEIVFADRFIHMKNLESVVVAFAKLIDPSFTLILIGEGPIEPLLQKLVDELGIRERVTFLPPMNPFDLYRRITNCYYVIVPSWTEISPDQVFECLSLGIPILMTKENYLPLGSLARGLIMIDPASVETMAATMNALLDQKTYEAFVERLERIKMKRPWSDVVTEHIKLFSRNKL